MREAGSRAVVADAAARRMPHMRWQKLQWRGFVGSLLGGRMTCPAAARLRRPAALRPPRGFLPFLLYVAPFEFFLGDCY